MTQQHTILSSFTYEGIGVHSGQVSKIRVLPALANTGIVFHKMKDDEILSVIPAQSECVKSGLLRTVLVKDNYTIETPEHLLAAFYGLGIDNAIVQIWGNEIPIIDGSADTWVNFIEASKIITQDIPKSYIKIQKSIKCEHDLTWCMIEPAETFQLCYSLEYSHPKIGAQNLCINLTAETFKQEISAAKTFGFLKDLEPLRKIGLAKGATSTNTVVFAEQDIHIDSTLNWQNEPARHKLLDAVGDLSLIGHQIIGKFTGYKSGHRLNQQLVQKILTDPTAYSVIN